MTRRRRAAAILSLMAAATVAAAWTFTAWRSRAGEAKRLWAQGVTAVNAGRYDEAKGVWARCSAIRPENADCAAGAALLARQEALEAQAAPSLPALQEDDIALATRLLAEARYSEAVALARVVLDRDPGNILALSMVKLYAARASAEATLAKAEPADEDDKRRAIKHWNEGIKFFQKNEPAKARGEWQACRRSDPGNPDCIEGLKRLASTYGENL